jgi:glycosyltransferase involved in cell wall biosynthesis
MKAKKAIKVCHCSILHKLDDSRIFYKECITLASAGYNVTFIAKSGSKSEFEDSTYQGVTLQVLKSNNRLYNNVSLFVTLLNQRINVVHFHDPELIILGLFMKLLGKKIIYDVHENVRQDIMHKVWLKPILRYFLSKAAVFLESLASNFFNGIISATPTIAKNFNNNNTYVVRNFPTFKKQEVLFKIKEKKYIIIYIGTLSKTRGIQEIISAAGHLIGVAELWLLGTWNDELFRTECEEMLGYKNTRYIGVVNHEDVAKILSEVSIGLCTLHPIDTFKDSYPIKVFEYMQNGIPVLMSNFDMWQELFGNSSEYIDPMNPLKIAEKIMEMLNNPTRLEEMSRKGQIAVNEQYNWDSESRLLVEFYNKILM